MFTDMVGFTATAQADEAGALRLLGEEESLVRPIVAAHQGREIKSTGDGFLIEFGSALRAVQCAIDIQRQLLERNTRGGVPPIVVRIGIHLGDVEERGTDIFGDAVNIASRVEPLALPGGICITAEVFNQVRNKLPNRFEHLGARTLKHLDLPVETYRVALLSDEPETAPVAEGPTRYRIAVLPLANISPDPTDEYFADGLTEELISTLSKVTDLRVIARTSVTQYKSTPKSILEIGKELGVRSILEGSVRKSGHRLRISLQLIDATSQEPIWAETYNRELNDVFTLQTEIAERTTGALRLELLGPDRELIRKPLTTNVAAYNLYLKALHVSRTTTDAGYRAAVGWLEDAIRLDPNFAAAYSSLANLYILQAGDALAPTVAFPRAKEYLAKALALDPQSSDAHAVRGNLALQHEQDWPGAEASFRRAIALNPSNSGAHFWYSMLLTSLQRFDEAIEEARTTIALDPLWRSPVVLLMVLHYYTGNFDAAIASAEEQRDRAPEDPGSHVRLGICFVRAGRSEDARREVELAARLGEDKNRLERAFIWAALGRPEEARTLAEEWVAASKTEYVRPANIALLFAAIGDPDRALAWLEVDYRSGDRFLWICYQWYEFDAIRNDPRFVAMLHRMNLPTTVSRLEGGGGTAGRSV
jgi:adenylate cyclase